MCSSDLALTFQQTRRAEHAERHRTAPHRGHGGVVVDVVRHGCQRRHRHHGVLRVGADEGQPGGPLPDPLPGTPGPSSATRPYVASGGVRQLDAAARVTPGLTTTGTVTPTASGSSSTCPAPGAGTGTSSTRSALGPP